MVMARTLNVGPSHMRLFTTSMATRPTTAPRISSFGMGGTARATPLGAEFRLSDIEHIPIEE